MQTVSTIRRDFVQEANRGANMRAGAGTLTLGVLNAWSAGSVPHRDTDGIDQGVCESHSPDWREKSVEQ